MASLSTTRLFPFDIVEDASAPVGDGTKWPVGFTRDELFQIMYNFRRLSLYLSVTASDPINPPESQSILSYATSDEELYFSPTCLLQWDKEYPSAAVADTTAETASEKRLLLTGIPGGGNMQISGCPPDSLPCQVALNFLAHPGQVVDEVVCYLKDNLYWPLLYVWFEDGDQREFSSYEAQFPDFEEMTATFYVGHSSVTGKMYGSTGYSLSGQIGFDPFKWWAYDPVDLGDTGGPIWDEDTGSQLRNPFSVQP